MDDTAVLDSLIDAYLDGALAADAKRELATRLCGEASARDHFWCRVFMHASIRRVYESRRGTLAAVDAATLTELAQLLAREDECAPLVELSEEEIARRAARPRAALTTSPRLPMPDQGDYAFDPTPVRHIVIPRPLVYGAAAAALVLLFLLIWPALQPPAMPETPVPADAVVATLSSQREARWRNAHDAIALGTPLREGRQLQLASGLIELTMAHGVVVVVEGPASMRLSDASHIELERGKLGARVVGAPFTVTTPMAEVIDRGTVFEVALSDSGATDVAVFEGNVELRERVDEGRPARSLLLPGGFKGSVDAWGVLDSRAHPLPAGAFALADAFDPNTTRYLEDFQDYATPTTGGFRQAELRMVTLDRRQPPQTYGVLELPPGSGNRALVFTADAQSGWLQGGFFRIDDLNPGQAVTRFTVNYRYYIARGSKGYFTNGFALNFGDFGDQTNDDLYNREHVFVETGWRRGLAISIRPYDSPDSDVVEHPTIEVRLDDYLIATYDNVETFLHENRWVDVTVTWSRDEGLTVMIDGTVVFENLQVALQPQPGWRFAFTARQGGIQGHQAIDDIRIATHVAPLNSD